MNPKARPFSIYSYDQTKKDNDGIWHRVRSFKTMKDAFMALTHLTRTRKGDRRYCYIILPNDNEQKTHILFKDEHKENILKVAK